MLLKYLTDETYQKHLLIRTHLSQKEVINTWLSSERKGFININIDKK